MSDNFNNSSSNNASPRTNAVGRSLSTKREDYLEWSDYFMAIAFLSAQRSKDPRTQVGACIVNEEKKIVGIGYNGMPNKCSDDNMPWGREADNILETKQLYVCHAELNAVLNKNSADVKNCSIYVALFPCNECAKVVIQSGIKEVIYYSDKYHERPEFRASKRMFDMAGVKYRYSGYGVRLARTAFSEYYPASLPKLCGHVPGSASASKVYLYRQYRPAQKQIVIDFTTIDEMSNGVIADMDSLSLSPKSENSVPDSTS